MANVLTQVQQKLPYDEWVKQWEELSADEYSEKMKDYLIEAGNMDRKSKKMFQESYDYMLKIIAQQKQFEPSLFVIYLKDVCGYNDIGFADVIRVLELLVLCGFEISIPEK